MKGKHLDLMQMSERQVYDWQMAQPEKRAPVA
jgi:hypothetical protein